MRHHGSRRFPPSITPDLRPPSPPGHRARGQARFRRSGYLALRDVTCVARDGVVHLHGCLPTYYLKQVAQSVASEIEGVLRVSNHIEVLAPAGRAPLGGDRATTRVGGMV